jgi:CubicO group peptidase (beta-lactamase class C family)
MVRVLASLALLLPACVRTAAGDPLTAKLHAGAFPRTTSVLAQQGGRTVYEVSLGGTDAQTLHDPRSVMKSVTALAVGIAIGEGTLPSADAPAFAFLSDLRPFENDGPLKAGVTLADLLTMSSALDCDDNSPESPGNEEHMYPRREWARWAVDLPVKAGWQRDARGRGPFAYCTAGTLLLGQVLQRATGEPVDRYVESRLLAPLGIRDVQWPRSPSGEVMTGGGLRMRTRDMAKLGRLLLQRGRWEGRQVVPAAWVDQALTVHRSPPLALSPGGELGYGYLFWHRLQATPCGPVSGWYMSGNGGNQVLVLPELDAVVVVTTVNYGTRGMHQQTVRLLEEHVLPKLDCRARRP